MDANHLRRVRRRLPLAVLAAALTVVCCLLTSDGARAGVAGAGTQRWTASYDYGTPAFSWDVAVSPDGSTVVSTGETVYSGSGPDHAATVAVDASTGATKWAAVYRSSVIARQRDRGTRVAISPDGTKVFVTGNSLCISCGGDGFGGFFTVAYDASTGQQLWAAEDANNGPGAYSIAVSPDGTKVFVQAGNSNDNGSITAAYDASTGAQLYEIQSTGLLVPWNALAVSPDSSTVFVASTTDTFGSCGDHVTAYDASTGSQLWAAFYPNCTYDRTLAIAISPDGSTLYATGSGSLEFSTVAYDTSTGAQRWASVTDHLIAGGDIQPSVAAGPDGSKVFVLGEAPCSPHCSDQPLVTIAYDASTGTQLWESRYDSGGTNYPADIAVSADSSQVYIAGQEQMPCNAPCTTAPVNAPLVAYDTDTGAEAWVQDYLNNSPFALTTSPTGSNVYVAGTFTPASAATAPHRPVAHTAMARRANSCSSIACGYSTTATNAHAGPGTSQDRDPSPRLDGWRTVFDASALGGAYRASRDRGKSVSFRTPKTNHVAWIAYRGPKEGKARVLVDGHSRGTFDLYARIAGAHTFSFTGLRRASHTVTIEVLGKKAAASSGRWVTMDGFKAGGNISQETALTVRYGGWSAKSSRSASGGSYRKSGSAQSRVSLVFTGRSITWVTARGRAYGRARVVIDGVAHSVDLYRSRHHWQVRLEYRRLGPGTHTISVRPLGSKDAASHSTDVVFDAFVVH